MNEVMVDIEALDSRRTAIVVSIGAVYFDVAKQELGDEFYMEMSYDCDDQYSRGRTFSFDTFRWWMAQSDSARSVFLPAAANDPVHFKHGTAHVLSEFSKFLNKYTNKVKLWGNGVNYDNVVLRDLYTTYNIGCPFTYQNDRCYRTIKNLFDNTNTAMEREGTYHNGLSDAISQAKHLLKMLKNVKVNT